MTLSPANMKIRPLQHRDLEEVDALVAEFSQIDGSSCSIAASKQLQHLKSWYTLLKFLRLLPNPFGRGSRIYVAHTEQKIRGLIQVSPFNSARTTWRVDWVLANSDIEHPAGVSSNQDVGSQLLRYCFETIWEARTWLLEVDVNHQQTLALYRQNGFQPLAQMTYWSLTPQLLEELAEQEPELPNLLPVNNADAQLLYQLDTASMPPLLRQVFDRHIQDFKTHFFGAFVNKVQRWIDKEGIARGYVFEPQRKAAIGHFNLELCKDGSHPHTAQLTVHPAYTWLYPKLLIQMAQIVQTLPNQSLELASADYQPEREEYLEQLGADRVKHTLLMSRSVWHKLRETKPLEGLQLSDVLQRLQPARTPVPTRMMLETRLHSPQKKSDRPSERTLPKENLGETLDSSSGKKKK